MHSTFSFSPDEWTILTELPIQVLAAAIRADKTSELGLLRQQARGLAELSSRANEYASSPLVQAVFDKYKDQGEGETQTLQLSQHWDETLLPGVIEHAREARHILDAKTTPEDASAYKLWLLETAAAVCAVSRIGGLLGFGGIRISGNEQILLDDLATAFGLPVETDEG